MTTPDAERRCALGGDLDLGLTLAPLAHGRWDPTLRLTANQAWRATRTPYGPATVGLTVLDRRELQARAWGPGAEHAVATVEALVGLHDEPERFVPRHRLLAELARRLSGLRLPRSRSVFEALLPAVLEQKVTGVEARRVYRALLAEYGEPAPGPGGLRLQPAPSVLAGLPYYAYHRLGLERRRADVVRLAAMNAARLEETASLPLPQAYERVRSIRGIGPWTAAEVGRTAFGDPDALSIGDYHVPSLVCWALAGERRGDEARMLELLEPYRGQRGRVQRLLEASRLRPPRRGPRMAPRSFAHL